MATSKSDTSRSEDMKPPQRDELENVVLSREEAILLQRLCTLQGQDYEAKYFDNKLVPRGTNYRQLGNPSAL